jgi:hypothetical protein
VEYDEKDKRQDTKFLESMYNTNQRKLFQLGYKLRFIFDANESIGIPDRDKAQKLLDRQAGFIKIHRSVRAPGIKGAYYEDKQSGCSVTDCVMAFKSRVTSNQLFISLDQVKGSGTFYSLSFIDMYDMEVSTI